MKILAIETSCDETSIALVEASGGFTNPKFKILENLVSSQIKIHAPYGGVVPNLAKREHLRNLPILWRQIAKRKGQIDLIAVTVGPGLEPALWTGINFAEDLYNQLKIENSKLKISGVSHLDGHLYSFLLPQKTSRFTNLKLKNLFPAVALIISGGHTILLLMKNLKAYKVLGETRDDAVGECFDKAARLLGLPYPGGPEIEKIARQVNPQAINFPKPMIDQKNYDFSFSGLKTAVLYYLRDNNSAKKEDVAASFQKAAFDVLIKKTLRASQEFKAKSVIVSGGVIANKELRRRLKKEIKTGNNLQLLLPSLEFSTDNAAMIAAGAYMESLLKKKLKLEANGNLRI